MGFFKNIIKNAVSDGISKGIRDAVSSAAEKIVAPKAEAYANSVADTLDEATQTMNAAQMEAAVQEPKEDFLVEWNSKLAGFPVWCFRGSDFEIIENGNTSDGNPYYLFEAEDVPESDLNLYVSLLYKTGFTRVYPSGESALYKEVNGMYLVFSKAEAFNAAPHMTLGMYRTTDKTEFMP